MLVTVMIVCFGGYNTITLHHRWRMKSVMTIHII